MSNYIQNTHTHTHTQMSSNGDDVSRASSSSSNHSPFSSNKRSMEDVWKDIIVSGTNHRYRGFILQDFLAKPFASNDIPTTVSSPASSQPQMLLNLNSHPDQLNFGVEDPTRNDVPSNSSSGLLGHNIGGGLMSSGGDRRHKRMIKNRESAARSRARKQAYTNELENEVERLKEENALLKRQQQIQVATAAQMTKKRGLQRTSTAPF